MSITELNRIMNQLLSSIQGKQENSIQQNVFDLYKYILDPEFDEFLLQLCFLYYVTDDKKLKELLYNYAQTNNSNYYRLVWTLEALKEDSKSKKVKESYKSFLRVIIKRRIRSKQIILNKHPLKKWIDSK